MPPNQLCRNEPFSLAGYALSHRLSGESAVAELHEAIVKGLAVQVRPDTFYITRLGEWAAAICLN